jgi:hypothetical protein
MTGTYIKQQPTGNSSAYIGEWRKGFGEREEILKIYHVNQMSSMDHIWKKKLILIKIPG